jgi:predicted O-methyltransferase YrrM
MPKETTKRIVQGALLDPFGALKMIWRRKLPIGIRPKDKEAQRIASWNYGKLKREPIQEIFPQLKHVDVELKYPLGGKVGTSLDPYELLIIAALAKLKKSKSILEIGTFDGNASLNIAANSVKGAVITTVDLPPQWGGRFKLKVKGLDVNVTDRGVIGEKFKNTAYGKKIKQVFADSAQLDYRRLPIPFDLVLIDGCHGIDYIKSDSQNALEFTRKGGLIIWHDYGMIRDVSLVVDRHSKTLDIHAVRGTRLAIAIR